MSTQLKNKNNECTHDETVIINGETVCKICGQVLEKNYVKIDYKNKNEPTEKLGSHIDYPHTGIFKDSAKNRCNNQNKLHQQKKLNNISKKDERGKKEKLILIKQISMDLNLNQVMINDAQMIYKKLFAKKHVRNSDTLSAVAIITASHNQKSPLALVEIAQAFTNREISRVSKKSISRLRDKLSAKYPDIIPSKRITQCEQYLMRIINKILASNEIRQKLKELDINQLEYRKFLIVNSQDIVKKLGIMDRQGINPYLLATAIVYAAGRVYNKKNEINQSIVTQLSLNTITKNSEASIRDKWNEIIRPIING